MINVDFLFEVHSFFYKHRVKTTVKLIGDDDLKR